MSVHPQTPQSPCRFSPATSSDSVMGLAAAAAASSSSSSAASAAAAAAAAASSSSCSLATLPTPAHSVNGANSQLDLTLMDSPHKRKRPLDDIGSGRDRKKMHRDDDDDDDDRMGIEDLHLDVGRKYLLCQTTYPESFPPTSEDLYQMFGLTALATEVAREKPNGEKNALRKTYKGHIKRLGVAGHFDVQKKNEDAPSDFMAMVALPELEWNVHQVKGRDISDGLAETTLSSLSRAVTLSRGTLSKSVWDTSVLGDVAPAASDASKPQSAKATAPNTPLASTPNAMGRSKAQLPVGPDAARPRRNNKKRSYGDSSFEGYGEGYPDDDAGVDTGYSTGEGDGGQKRRKKNPSNSPTYSSMRQQSYGPGMVGA